jgi:hypothetical protein
MLDGTSIKDHERAMFIGNLAFLEGLRLDGTANIRDVLFVPPESGKLPSFRELIASFPGPMDVKPDWKTHITHIVILVPHIDQLTDIADIEDGIKYCRLLLVSYHRSDLASVTQVALGMLLGHAFRLTHKIEYLNEAISSTRDGLNTVQLFGSRVSLLHGLTAFL